MYRSTSFWAFAAVTLGVWRVATSWPVQALGFVGLCVLPVYYFGAPGAAWGVFWLLAWARARRAR